MGPEYGAATQIGNEIALTSCMRRMSPVAYLLAMRMAQEDDHDDEETIALSPLDPDQQAGVDEQIALRGAAVAEFHALFASGADPCACGWHAGTACEETNGCLKTSGGG